MSSRSVRFAAISVMIFSLALTACAPGILGSKDPKGKSPGSAGAADQPRLAKPKIPDDRALGSLAQKDGGETSGTTSGKSRDTFAAPAKGAKAENPSTERVSSSRSDPGKDTPDSGNDKQSSGQSSSEIQKSGASIRTASTDIRGDAAVSGKPGSDASPEDLPFQRHDHKKYMQRIKNKAIEQLNKEKDVTYARLCTDSTTDEWSLWLYRFEGKVYRIATYTWDPVDEGWKESLKPDKQSIAGLRHHLKFTSDGKKCDDLKGKRP